MPWLFPVGSTRLVSIVHYLGGNDSAKFIPFCTHLNKSSSDSWPFWETITQPFIGLSVFLAPNIHNFI
jgi:hypothetical protein